MSRNLILASLGGALFAAALATACTNSNTARSDQAPAKTENPAAAQPATAVALHQVTLEVLGMT